MAQVGVGWVAVGDAAGGEAEEGAVGAGIAVGEEGDETAGGGAAEGGEVDGLEGCDGGDDERGGQEEEVGDEGPHFDRGLIW